MRGRLSLLAATGVLCALVLVVSLVSVSAARPNVARLAVVEHATTDTLVDLTANGDSTGDLLTFHNELFDETNTEVVGSNQGECVRIEVGVSWECRWVNFFEDGSITVEGPFFDAKASALAITGGTGIYRAARGSMRLVARDEAGSEFDFIFRILTA
ncbi:MAG TPA: allene oxide cyclase family protein [Actinomycetota bacterium]|nr:allene oxide cyclase family protein [Actinomycetota bacterium]